MTTTAPSALRILLFGATGMVGRGVLRECLLDPGVAEVLVVGRTALGESHPKLRELVHTDLFDLRAVERQLTGFDACFFCLGVSAGGLSEAQYTRLTHDLTLAVAQTLARLSPSMVFTYVSGAGTDATERGPRMWARVKGRTENALLALPFAAAYMFRPAGIRAMHGERSKTGLYRLAYAATGWLMPLAQRLAPDTVTTTEHMGRAMLAVVQHGAPRPVLEGRDINALGAR